MATPPTRVLLLYPKFPVTFWGFQYMLPALGKRALMPPLGLITVAAMCGDRFEFRLVDTNCRPLEEADLQWAEMVWISAMMTQRQSMEELATRCRAAGKPVILGGPYCTSSPEACAPFCDVIVQGEAETTLPTFLADLDAGRLQPLYSSAEKPDVTLTPVPRFDLVDVDHYLSFPLQYSRGCPFQCEFCDIIVMFGRRPRTKTPEQVCRELEAIHATGYRGQIFIVDDNFIGNKKQAMSLLPAIRAWNQVKGRPFVYGTEASVDLARYPELMKEMVASDFHFVFLGIETPSAESLKETRKLQNLKGSLVEIVQSVMGAGLRVTAGFIIGFDADDETIFDRQIEFIDRAGIPMPTVGLLTALPGTPLHARMRAEGRLMTPGEDDTFTLAGHFTNIRTRIDARTLFEGYRRVISELYAPAAYFRRAHQEVCTMPRAATLRERMGYLLGNLRRGLRFFQPSRAAGAPGGALPVAARMGVLLRYLGELPASFKWEAARLLWRVARDRPDQLGGVVDYTVAGYHLFRFSQEHVLPQVDQILAHIEEGEDTAERLSAVG